MPGLDKTGPMGMGSQTGRKQGTCQTENELVMEETPRRNRSGRGFRNRFRQGEGNDLPEGKGRGLGRGMRQGKRR